MISYEELVQKMENTYQEKTGIQPTADSDTGVCFRVLAGELYSLSANVEWLKASLLPQTAAGEQLDKLAQQAGLSRTPAAKAQGTLRFTKTAKSTIFTVILSAGTRCTTGGSHPVVFETLEQVELDCGPSSVAEVPVRAVKDGEEGNVLAGTVTQLEKSNAYIEAVTNPAAFSGGRTEETDDQLRKRLMEEEKQTDNGANSAFYRKTALQQPGVSSVFVQTAVPEKGGVTIWLASRGASVTNDTAAKVKAALEQMRGLNVQIKVYPAKTTPVQLTVQVKKKEGQTDEDTKTAVQQAMKDSFDELKIGQTMTAARLMAAIMQTGCAEDVLLPTNLVFPTAAPDTLVTLNAASEVVLL
ncbi:hypothetical protein B6259_00680 [Ruminococcaceae bacterium CPB6]|uniref:Baseplate protein J-like barrel domain-containing protein n=1 Tax=Caproicibacterium lactatifermentans TaxID=2666138 RepID=A0A859DN26_9FIRM|nr:baseplate J/gp47 family protein [Caproicibacterium lactatifermentans]ARP49539.1 hypothetical protein B6259_00680 [Ruminococcaceae bacterium CPB6]QKN23126.1 hypothetical protein GJQ69_00660 [Caproicibacterium lactatifermentans]